MDEDKFDAAIAVTLRLVRKMLAAQERIVIQDLWNTSDGSGSEHIRDAVRILLESGEVQMRQSGRGPILMRGGRWVRHAA